MNDSTASVSAPSLPRFLTSVILAIGIPAAVFWGIAQGDRSHFQTLAEVLVLVFGIQGLMFVHAWIARTERWFDLTGSLTFIAVALFGFSQQEDPSIHHLVVAALITVWALRLGSFLAIRIHRAGEDRRFRAIKQSFRRFLLVWCLQGTWVSLTTAVAIAVLFQPISGPNDLWLITGTALWLFGFVIEVVADRQKQTFRSAPENATRFIASGLWAISRHPNYVGEILLWLGIAFIGWPHLSGWQHVSLISPVFVYLLLTKMSGIPMLESAAAKQWSDDPSYQQYIASTPMLWPRLWRRQ